jgi:hypothetical protein
MRPQEDNVLTRTVVAVGCALSAGVHAGLVPEHLEEAPRLGLSFIAATALLMAVAAAVAVRPPGAVVVRVAELLLAALVAGYLASRAGGIPLLEPEPERVDGLGVATKAVELIALVAALRLDRTPGVRRAPLTQEVTR